MRILITGATGLVGKEITALCHQKNIDIHYLTTQKSKVTSSSNYKGFYWNPSTQDIDANCLEGVTAIINLAGASVSKRWTKAYKKTIENSRINTVKLLVKLLSENEHKVSFLASASAMGIYASSFEIKYKESDTASNNTFLGTVVSNWEKELNAINSLGLTVAKLRIGVVLSKSGGALVEMTKPIKLGLGAAVGNGKQYQSWIHVEDLARLFLFVVENCLTGTYNAVASNPSTNAEMTKMIAKTLKKTLWLPNIPGFMMQLLLGEMSTIMLESQYLKNEKIKNFGFEFTYNHLKDALENLLLNDLATA